jgi:hypothetical protein
VARAPSRTSALAPPPVSGRTAPRRRAAAFAASWLTTASPRATACQTGSDSAVPPAVKARNVDGSTPTVATLRSPTPRVPALRSSVPDGSDSAARRWRTAEDSACGATTRTSASWRRSRPVTGAAGTAAGGAAVAAATGDVLGVPGVEVARKPESEVPAPAVQPASTSAAARTVLETAARDRFEAARACTGGITSGERDGRRTARIDRPTTRGTTGVSGACPAAQPLTWPGPRRRLPGPRAGLVRRCPDP